ncbi:Protein tanc2 [Phlyctochytrium bullatum]|nr:Protein tanc2 [Phlyctochytrium bullatum]
MPCGSNTKKIRFGLRKLSKLAAYLPVFVSLELLANSTAAGSMPKQVSSSSEASLQQQPEDELGDDVELMDLDDPLEEAPQMTQTRKRQRITSPSPPLSRRTRSKTIQPAAYPAHRDDVSALDDAEDEASHAKKRLRQPRRQRDPPHASSVAKSKRKDESDEEETRQAKKKQKRTPRRGDHSSDSLEEEENTLKSKKEKQGSSSRSAATTKSKKKTAASAKRAATNDYEDSESNKSEEKETARAKKKKPVKKKKEGERKEPEKEVPLVPYAAHLTKVEKSGGEIFYSMKIMQKGKLFMVRSRYGTVGTPGKAKETQVGNSHGAVSLFKKTFKDKTGNDWENRHDCKVNDGKYIFRDGEAPAVVKDPVVETREESEEEDEEIPTGRLPPKPGEKDKNSEGTK